MRALQFPAMIAVMTPIQLISSRAKRAGQSHGDFASLFRSKPHSRRYGGSTYHKLAWRPGMLVHGLSSGSDWSAAGRSQAL